MLTAIKNYLMDYAFYIVLAVIIIVWMFLHFRKRKKKGYSIEDVRNIPFVRQKRIAEHELDRLIFLNFKLVKSEEELEKAYIERKDIAKRRKNDLKERYNQWYHYYNGLKRR